MTTEVKTQDTFANIERVLIQGDLKALTAQQKLDYYSKVCETMGLNPLTQPFSYITLNGKEVLYATKGCAEQLRKVHGVSLRITSTSKLDDIYVVVVEAADRSGRTDAATGAVSVAGLKGDALANAFLKCETKAKRRATLSICSLNMLDESEVETIQRTNPFAAKNHQPEKEDGGGPVDSTDRYKEGTFVKRSPAEIYNDPQHGKDKLIKFLGMWKEYVATGVKPEKHDIFKHSIAITEKFLNALPPPAELTIDYIQVNDLKELCAERNWDGKHASDFIHMRFGKKLATQLTMKEYLLLNEIITENTYDEAVNEWRTERMKELEVIDGQA